MNIFKAFKGFKKKSDESVDLKINNPIQDNHEEENHNQIEDTINWTVDNDDYENIPDFNLSDENNEEKSSESYSSYDEYIRKNPTSSNDEINSNEINYMEEESKKNSTIPEPRKRESIEPFEINKQTEDDEIQVAISKKPEIKNHVNTEVGSRLLDSDRYSKEENNKKILNRIEDRHIQIIYQEVTKSSSQWDFFERLEKQQIPLEFLVALNITFEGVIENYRILKARQLNVHNIENDSFIQDMISYDTYSEETRQITEKLKEHNEKKDTEIKEIEKEKVSSTIKGIFEEENSDIFKSIFDDDDDSFDEDGEDFIEDIDFDSLEEDEETKKIMEKLQATIENNKQEEKIESKQEDEINIKGLSVLEQLAKQIEMDKEEYKDTDISQDAKSDEVDVSKSNQQDKPEFEEVPEDTLDDVEIDTEKSVEVPEDVLDDAEIDTEISVEIPEDTLDEIQNIPIELPEDSLVDVVHTDIIQHVEDIQIENNTTKENNDFEINEHLKDDLLITTKDENPEKEKYTELAIPIKKEEEVDKRVLNITQNKSKLSDTLSKIIIDTEKPNTLNDTIQELDETPNKPIDTSNLDRTNDVQEELETKTPVLEINKEEKNEPEDNPIIDVTDSVSIQNPKTETKNIFVVSEYALLPNIKGYKFIKVNTIKDIYKYSSSGQNLLVLTTEIPKELIKELGSWLKSIMKQEKKFRIVTLEGFEISHNLIEQTIKLNKVSLDAYYEEHPKELYKQNSIGSFKDLSYLFLDE